ncbi:hypothetical protein [Paenibacillus jiagnxiensis]|uniref:hypothetical protein n=1 Tax=Paenibacillus jiagnxiensis TaxID=3228926 RepID=UPI0033BBB0A9
MLEIVKDLPLTRSSLTIKFNYSGSGWSRLAEPPVELRTKVIRKHARPDYLVPSGKHTGRNSI